MKDDITTDSQAPEESYEIEEVSMFRVGSKAFETEKEAFVYSKRGEYQARINDYIGSREWKRGRDTAAYNVLMDFLAYEDTK